MSQEQLIFCCACRSDVQSRLANGSEIYSHRPDLAAKSFWKCPHCNNYVGCHPGGTKPLGNIPTPELRKARNHIHSILDPIWRSKKMARGKVYAIISERLGYQYHTGEIKSLDDARLVYRLIKEISP